MKAFIIYFVFCILKLIIEFISDKRLLLCDYIDYFVKDIINVPYKKGGG